MKTNLTILFFFLSFCGFSQSVATKLENGLLLEKMTNKVSNTNFSRLKTQEYSFAGNVFYFFRDSPDSTSIYMVFYSKNFATKGLPVIFKADEKEMSFPIIQKINLYGCMARLVIREEPFSTLVLSSKIDLININVDGVMAYQGKIVLKSSTSKEIIEYLKYLASYKF